MRVTARGVGLVVAGLILIAVGFRFGYPELATLGTAALVAVAGATIFVSWRPRLTVARQVEPDRVMRGQSSSVTLEISNASRVFGASLVARDRVQPGAFVSVPLLRLRPGLKTRATYDVPTSRRGVLDIGPLEVTRADPIGLAGVVRRYGETARVWVRPRVHEITAIPAGLARSLDGRVEHVRGGSSTFSALREYVVGDDLRHVHWRTSARVGELMVREYVDTSLPRIVILLDDRAQAHGPGPDGESSFEAACEAAASVAVAAITEGVHVELHLVCDPRIVEGDAAAVLDALAEATPAPGSAGAGTAGAGTVAAAVARLAAPRLGDTVVYLTGTRAGADDIGAVAGLADVYPIVIASTLGSAETGLSVSAGTIVLAVGDGAGFAAAWEGMPAW